MLVLSRKAGQRIVIGQEVEVKVLQVRGNQVKLGIVGPKDIPVHREEVARRVGGAEDAARSAEAPG